MLREAFLRQCARIVAELKLEIPHMVRCNDNFKLSNTSSGIGGLHVSHSIVTLGSAGRITADPMLVLGMGVPSE
jgi:hypothetical protein